MLGYVVQLCHLLACVATFFSPHYPSQEIPITSFLYRILKTVALCWNHWKSSQIWRPYPNFIRSVIGENVIPCLVSALHSPRQLQSMMAAVDPARIFPFKILNWPSIISSKLHSFYLHLHWFYLYIGI